METLIILAQTKTAAAIEILIFLVVAAVIGFLTAYFYYKPIYMKKIHGLEDDISGLKKEIEKIENKITDLEKTIGKKDEVIQELRQELEKKNKKD